jgi:hypothetical protein
VSFLELVAHVKWFSRVSALLRKNARRSVEMIEKYYAAYLKTQLDASHQYHARKTEEETYSQKALPALQRVISPAKCNFRLVALSWNLVRKFHAGVAKSADAADLRN